MVRRAVCPPLRGRLGTSVSEATSGSPGGERWLPVVGYEGMYEVSDQGRVWSVPRVDRMGRRQGGRMLRPSPNVKSGYPTVQLRDGLTGSPRTVHSLVASAFLGPKPAGAECVRHLNDNPADNRVENLAWGTKKENSADAWRNGAFTLSPQCARGHDMEGGNLRIRPINGRIGRVCRACQRAGYSLRKHPGLGASFQELADAHYRKIAAGDTVNMTAERILSRYG